ncbi:MAG: hypothetical protein HC792_03120 [Acaryochloridaceae cyanobacterium CSU_5_19]|nr:hypothetical protein [Acaryochloridaceae cyanobacterium CSU_5_19]
MSMVIWGSFLWQIGPILVQQVLGYPGLISSLFQQLFWTSQGLPLPQLGTLITSTFLVMVAIMLSWWPLTRVILLLWRGLIWLPKRMIQSHSQQP